MAYNFELTFTRPLLAKLDAGVLKGSKDWANAITDAYINTIKSGLPVAVPPILPAPGLNPTAPPPFAIGVSPYLTADLRRRSMYRVVHAYFSIRELKLDKASILSIKSNIALLIKKVKERIKQVRLVVEEIKMLREELKVLPKLTKDIIQDIRTEIKDQIKDIEDAFKVLDGIKVTMSLSDFESLFANEINLLDKIKNFDPTKLISVSEFSLLLSSYGSRSENVLANFESTMSVRQYLYGKIVGVGKILVQLAEGVIDPSKILNVVNDLATKKTRIQSLAKRLQQFTYYLNFLQPKLKKLQNKKTKLVNSIKKTIQVKIADLKKKLQAKIQEVVKKKQEGKRSNLYSKAAKNKIDRKKKNQQRIKSILKKINKIKTIYKLIVEAVGKTVALTTSVKKAFNSIKADIADYQKKLERAQASALELSNTFSSVQLNAQTVTIPRPDVNLTMIEQFSIANEVKKLESYMKSTGLTQFSNLGVMVLTQTKCNIQTFTRFFEKKTRDVQMFVYEIVSLLELMEQIAKEVKNFNSDDSKSQKTQVVLPRLKSLKDILLFMSTQLIPKVQFYPKWAKTQTKKQKSKLQKIKEKFKQDLKSFALNMVPIKSDLKDSKDKAQELAAKERIVRDKIKQIKRLLRLSGYIAKMVKNGSTIYKNVEKGDYTLATNQQPIQNFLDAYYLYRADEQTAGVKQQLQEEKLSVFDTLKGIVIVDFLVRAFIQILKSPEKSKIISELNSDLEELKNNPPAFQTLSVIRDLFEAPPTNKKQLIDQINTLTISALQDVSVINKLIQLEKKYLKKTKELIKTVLDIKQIRGTKFEAIMIRMLQKINKNDSMIVLLIDTVKNLVKDFVRIVKTKIQNVAKKLKDKLVKIRQDKEAQFKKNISTNSKKKQNSDAIFMSYMFATAARLFWTGASWIGPTGSQHRVLGIGTFRPKLKGRPNEGASALIRQLAKAYELQLLGMRGFVIPPPPTGIPPLAFNGYK